MTRKSLFVAATLLAVVACSGEDETGPPDSNEVTVTVADDQFVPPTRTVEVGTTVHWNTTGTHGHNVTFDDEQSSDVLNEGDTYERTFSAPGEYHYVCTFHANLGMEGTIIVE
ncbi:MAG TPA: plastocyanin/azurin family copper-binding protein [Longimicrobiales bacterium]